MFAVAAVVAFAVALVLHLTGSDAHVLDFMLAGLACLAAHLVWGIYPWRHPQ
jgi:hypothetical protein